MSEQKGLRDFAAMARAECSETLSALIEQRKRITDLIEEVSIGKGNRKPKPGLIQSLITAQSICIDKEHHVLMRLRDLEAFGVEESTEFGAIIIQREDDGSESIVGEPPGWARLVAQAGRCPHCSDS